MLCVVSIGARVWDRKASAQARASAQRYYRLALPFAQLPRSPFYSADGARVRLACLTATHPCTCPRACCCVCYVYAPDGLFPLFFAGAVGHVICGTRSFGSLSSPRKCASLDSPCEKVKEPLLPLSVCLCRYGGLLLCHGGESEHALLPLPQYYRPHSILLSPPSLHPFWDRGKASTCVSCRYPSSIGCCTGCACVFLSLSHVMPPPRHSFSPHMHIPVLLPLLRPLFANPLLASVSCSHVCLLYPSACHFPV